MQLQERPVATMECEVCGRQTIRTTTAKNDRALVLDAEIVTERKVTGRFKLTDKGARRVGGFDEECGDPGYQIHAHKQSLRRAMEHHPDLADLHEATREALRGERYDQLTHDALKTAYLNRCKELGVEFGGVSMAFDADMPEPPDPIGWRPEGQFAGVGADTRIESIDTKLGEPRR